MTKPINPKYHRQQFLLILLELFGGRLTKMDFQKLLFLSQKETENKYYDFVPYLYGCYSFLAQSDIEVLESRGWLQIINNEIKLMEKPDFSLSYDEIYKNRLFSKKYENYRGNKLLHYIYKYYPYYAINSSISKSILETCYYEAVINEKEKLRSDIKVIYTIGYEGLSLEKYMNQLIYHDVRLLCDIRNNPLSRKFGFSKGTLKNLLPKLGIEYIHIPELGIISENRNNLETKSDYIQLFEVYKESLPQKKEILEKLFELYNKNKRIALTCFEKQHEMCHRHCVSEYLEYNKNIKVVHL